MAGIWELNINVIDVATKRAFVTATRTDGADIQTFGPIDAILDTSNQKTAVLDIIKTAYLDSLTRQSNIDAFVSDLQTTGGTALTNWEAGL